MKSFLQYSPKYDELTQYEEKLLAEDVELTGKAVEVSYKLNPHKIFIRNAHSKAFGFVRGSFEAIPNEHSALPEVLGTENLKVIVRYSHPSNFVTRGHQEYPVYGCSLKIYDENSVKSAQFPLVNVPVFITNSVSKFIKIHLKANKMLISISKKPWLSFFHFPSLLASGLKIFTDKEILSIFKNIFKVLKIEKQFITTYDFHSVGCFRWQDKMVKMRLQPENLPKNNKTSKIDQAKYLHSWFLENELNLDLQIQFAADDKKTPVNDLLKNWREKDSEFVTIGKIILPKQDISQYDNLDYENLSFNPFENEDGLKPVGKMMKIRQDIYKMSIETRQRLNIESIQK